MIKKTIKYTDYEGVERSEDFYFNLTQAELLKMEFTTDGGMQRYLEKMVNTQDSKKIIDMFEKIIGMSYGEKSLDGRQFMKSPELTNKFMQTEAYSELFMELLSNPDAASAFINGIVPAKVAAEAAKQARLNG